ncbi:MAG: hypothetical protein HKN28_02335 [Alphaproteobacteria bacterium]|nr:hypothetical protein [Alphaproteobacteria bacterium]
MLVNQPKNSALRRHWQQRFQGIGKDMLIGTFNSYQPSFDFGAAFAQMAQDSARPAFELQFFYTQDSILEQLNDEINNINNAVNTRGATALLNVQVSRLNNDLAAINDYKVRTDTKVSRVSDTLDNLAELATLAAPGTAADFDTLLAETIHLMQKTKAPTYERYGVQDRLRTAKTDGLAQLESLVHNNFATQADIDNTTAILTAIQNDYLASKSIIDSNTKIAFTLQYSGNRTIGELNRQISNIKTDTLSEATGKIKEKQEYYGQLLTAISLSFEASQAFATFIAESVLLPQKTDPGSVLNLFS